MRVIHAGRLKTSRGGEYAIKTKIVHISGICPTILADSSDVPKIEVCDDRDHT